MNLGKSGYGPFQYLEVLKRFGLKYKPRYALFAFYEGNDILDIRNYRRWRAGQLTTGNSVFFGANIFGRTLLARIANNGPSLEQTCSPMGASSVG